MSQVITGIVAGVLLVALYVSYLVILDASNPLVLVLVLASGIIQPVWYLALGWNLWQGEVATPARQKMATARR